MHEFISVIYIYYVFNILKCNPTNREFQENREQQWK